MECAVLVEDPASGLEFDCSPCVLAEGRRCIFLILRREVLREIRREFYGIFSAAEVPPLLIGVCVCVCVGWLAGRCGWLMSAWLAVSCFLLVSGWRCCSFVGGICCWFLANVVSCRRLLFAAVLSLVCCWSAHVVG